MSKREFKEKIKKLNITKNIGLKLISLAIAIIMWFVVINITDPLSTTTFKNVPVKLLNTNTVTSQGKTLEILNETDVISSVTIKASRSVISEIGGTLDYLLVTADLKNLSSDSQSVPIEISTTKYSDKIESIKCSYDRVDVNIENRKTIQLPITATTSGEIEEGYILGGVSTATNQVRISGPESKVSTIKTAVVDVQLTGFVEDISTQADIVLYDEEGEIISQDNLTLNVNNIRVTAQILATKTVPVYYSYTGTPEEGYEATGEIESDVNEIVIAGNLDEIDNISSITVPGEALDISNETGNLKKTVNLSDFLPSKIVFADSSFNGKANVTVYVEALENQEISVFLRNIEIENIPDGFEVTQWDEDEDYITFKVRGRKSNLEKIQLSELAYMVDFADYVLVNPDTEFEEGSYELPLNLILPEGVELSEAVLISVKLKEISEK